MAALKFAETKCLIKQPDLVFLAALKSTRMPTKTCKSGGNRVKTHDTLGTGVKASIWLHIPSQVE